MPQERLTTSKQRIFSARSVISWQEPLINYSSNISNLDSNLDSILMSFLLSWLLDIPRVSSCAVEHIVSFLGFVGL